MPIRRRPDASDLGALTARLSRPARPAPRAAIEPLEARRLMAVGIEVTDESGGVVIADGDDSPSEVDGTDFGSVPVGNARPFRSFIVRNTGTTPDDDLTLGGLAVPTGFRIEKDLPPLLKAGESASFTISLLDDAQTPREGFVTFNTNVPGAQTFDFAVEGGFVSASPEPDNIFEDVSSFTDTDTISLQRGTDPEGRPVDVSDTQLLRFNVPAGQAQVRFTLDATTGISEGATADAELLVLRDADGDQELDADELAGPVADPLRAPPDGTSQARDATLGAGTYFAFLRPANFAVTDAGAELPAVRLDYTLAATVTAVPAPGVTVTFFGTSVGDGDTSPSPDEGTDFGSVQVGQSVPQRTFTVTNSGNAALEIGPATVTGPFQIVTGLPSSLAPGASADLVVSMATTSVGEQNGAVSFATNVEGKNPFNFALEGNVTQNAPPTAPEVTVSLQAGGGALVDGQTLAVEFGTSPQGQAGATRRFVVRNDGSATLTLGGVTVPAGFTVTEPLATSLAPGQSDGFTVTLDTSALGERTGTLAIATNDANENPFDFPVRGAVVLPGATPAPEITVLLGTEPLPVGAAVDFGAAAVGTAGPERTLTLRNDGTAALSLGDVALPAGYTLIAGPALDTLVPGASTTVRIRLDTVSAGTPAGAATIANNDADEGPYTLNLTGVVTDAGVSPALLDVSNVTGRVPPVVIAGAARARGAVAFTVTNTSAAPFAGPVTFAAIASTDREPGDATDVQLVAVTRNVRLKAGAARTMRLKFRFPPGLAEGEQNVLVTAASPQRTLDQEPGPQVSVQAPFVRVAGLPGAVPAGRPLAFGRRATFAVPLQNLGNVPTSRTPATYTLIVSTGQTEAGEVFRTTATGRLNLRPNASRAQRVAVTFPPGAFPAGSYTLLVRLNAELNQTNGETVSLIPFTIA